MFTIRFNLINGINTIKKINTNKQFIRNIFFVSETKKFKRDEVLRLLELKEFSNDEIHCSYHRLYEASKNVTNNDTIDIRYGLTALFNKSSSRKVPYDSLTEIDTVKINNLANELIASNSHLNYEEYQSNTTKIGEKLNENIFPLALSFLCVGASVGIVIPCMPLIVKTLDIPSSSYGFVVGAFGLSKLLGNIPSGIYFDCLIYYILAILRSN